MLTRSGLGAAVAGLALVVCGFWWRYEELVVVGTAIFVAIVVALWSSRAPQRVQAIRTITSPRVARGDPIRAIYRVTNPTRRRIAPITIVDHCDDQWVRVPIAEIAPVDRVESVGLIPTRRRGEFAVGPFAIERIDPMHLSVGRRTSDQTGRILVHPRIHHLTGPYGAMHTVEDEALVRSAASDPLSGFVSLREYVHGDDPRLIHWPTTARMGTLMLREYVELRRPEFTVVLDTFETMAEPDDFEEMVDVAASIAVHALSNGVTVRLRTTSRAQPGSMRPLDRATQVLDILTPVQQSPPEESMAIAEVFQTGLDHAMIAFVTGPAGPSTVLRSVDRVSVIRIGVGATTSAGVSFAAVDAAEFVQRWRPWT